MKKSSISISVFLFIILTMCFGQLSLASEDYVGVKEGDVFIWKCYFDEDALDDLLDDGEEYLTVEPEQSGDDEFEDNDIFNDAKELNKSTHTIYYFNLNYTDDDWYKIYLDIGYALQVELYHWYFPFGFLELRIYDRNQQLLGYSNLTGYWIWIQSVSVIAKYSGFHYILVTNSTFDYSINYTLAVDTDPPPPPIDYSQYVENFFDDYEDIEGYKLRINKINEEDKFGVVDAVKVRCQLFTTKDFDDEDKWKERDDFNDFLIVDPGEDDYYNFIFAAMCLVVAKGLDWDDVAEDIEDNLVDEYENALIKRYLGPNIDVEVKANEEWQGISISFETDDKDLEDLDIYFRYHDDNGILEYGEVKYDGVPIATLELQNVIHDQVFLIGSGIVVASAGAIGLIIIIRHIIKKRRRF